MRFATWAHHSSRPSLAHTRWFEVFECFRRLLLSAGLVFITPGSPTQGVFAVLLSNFCQRIYSGCKPWPAPSTNRLGEMAQWQVLVREVLLPITNLAVSTAVVINP